MPDKREEQFNLLMDRISSHLAPEKVEQLRGIFADSPQAALQLGEEALAKSDYTRQVQQVVAQQQQLASEQARVTELANKIHEYDAYLRTSHVSREEYDTLAAERAQLKAAFDQLSTEYPSIVEDLSLTTSPSNPSNNSTQASTETGGTQTMPNPTPTPGNVPQNPIRNVTENQWTQDKQSLAALAMLSPAAQHDLAVRHQQLFGAPLANMTEIVQAAAETGRSLEEIWSEKHNVAAKLLAVEEARINQLVEERTQAEVAKRLSVGAVNGGVGVPNTAGGSPFLQRMVQEGVETQASLGAPDMTRIANQGTGQGSAAAAATAAYLSGKYRNDKFDMLST